MYAVIRTGGKQLRVAKNDVIRVEKLAAEDGAEITLDDVLMLGDGSDTTIGTPLVEGASVSATVLEQTRGDKIIVFKKKRRKNYRRRKGHRQDLTVLRIDAISPPGEKKAAKKAAAKPAAKTATEKTTETAKSDAEAAPKAEAKAKPAKKADTAEEKKAKAPAKKKAATAADKEKPAAKKSKAADKKPAEDPAADKE
ncbi:MAG: 50S ribosomal protein L21 [Alphaproteobacteria bacterium]|jgi:large subunit ribosomal protein L21|nr:50S ribosomal protein L21 [Rhodospirillaceae bacterium]MDP6406840.1 50S ribosomal protein L21 [Alphaproteobacteria bacterium]MDP6623724.1 50S ribosomal protein L21 [Alphaproteobacteria bacterium]|tara:strand:- start:19 stop:609 length:591 start_codon:yes stop_codon:yes gene_type:complete